MKDIEYLLSILHDLPTESKCRYYLEHNCIYKLEDDGGKNWCNNCSYWHMYIAVKFGVKTVYCDKPKGCLVLHASLVKELYK